MGKGKGLIVLGIAGVAVALALNAKSKSGIIYSYTSGSVTLLITAVDTQHQGFSFAILVNGNQIFADSIYAGDEEYTVQAGGYVVNYTSVNDYAALFVYDSQGNQVNPDAFNIYQNGTKV